MSTLFLGGPLGVWVFLYYTYCKNQVLLINNLFYIFDTYSAKFSYLMVVSSHISE